jgi:ABC-type transport system involved in cytochrome c biogenesis permease subunit
MSSDKRKKTNEVASVPKGGTLSNWISIILVSFCALYAISKLRPTRHQGDFDLTTFGQLPVQQKGRVKPLDTVARNALLVMRGKQTVPDGPEASYFERLFYGKKSPRYLTAIEWFAEITLNPKKADKYKVFRIDHPEVLGLFGFEPGKAKYFSFNDLFHSTNIENLRKEQDDILQKVNDYVKENPDASEKEKREMRESVIPQYEQAQVKLDSLIAKVTEVDRAIRSIKLGEDLNRNGRLDAGEDLNKNGKLDPGPDPKKHTPYQSNLANLYQAVTLYDQLKNALFPHTGVNLFGNSYSKEIKALAFHKELSMGALDELREELLASGALENESKLMEILSAKPKAMELIQADQSLKESEPFLRGQARFAPLGIVPPASYDGTVSIENGTDKITDNGDSLNEFLQAQSHVKVGSHSAFDGIWRENQLREKLIKSVDGDGTATLTNIHMGRAWTWDFLFYLSFGGIAYLFFKFLNRKRTLAFSSGGAISIFGILSITWLVLFGVPSATVKDVTLHNIDWTSLPDSLLESRNDSGTGQIDPTLISYADLSNAYEEREHAKFNGIVKTLSDNFEKTGSSQWHDFKNLMPEHKFNGIQPFVTCMALYLIALIFVFLSWLFRNEEVHAAFRKSGVGIAGLALMIHVLALVVRIWIQGRPPVTNLYSSAIFISLGAVFFGLIFERIYRNGIGTAAASIVGFLSLLVAHNLAMDGDTMEVLQAVLDTNFWLATHVVCITLGYVAMFVAGILAILYVLRGLLDRRLDKETARSISSMIFGVTCFAVLLSFVGTMLGGIWADKSWGRFWGWDPKENGALLIVIWSAIVLHARWGGLAKGRGIAALAIFGNVVTAWSWFGTNLLQEGLHSYGFSDSGFIWLIRFIGIQLFFIAIAYVPQRFWLSELGQSARKRKAENPVKSSSSSTNPAESQ